MNSEDEVGDNHANESCQRAANASLNVYHRNEVHQAHVENQSAEHGVAQRVEILQEGTVKEATDPTKEQIADGSDQRKGKGRPEIYM